MSRGHVIIESRSLVTETCCDCGVLFAMDSEHRQEFLDDHRRFFYCPNGHPQHYSGKTDAERLADAQRQLEQLNRAIACKDEDLRSERASHVATKGQLTRARRQVARVEKGVCPHCHRHFSDVERHMASKHGAS